MKFKNNVPFIPAGLELSQLSFSGGRILASIGNHGGLTHIDYFGEQRFGDARLFNADPISAWGQLFRICLSVDGDLYYLEFNDTRVFPFGYTSQCTFDGVTVQHELFLLNDALVNRIKVLRNPRKRKVAAAMLLMSHTPVRKSTRTWEGFETISPDNTFEATVIDQYTEVAPSGILYGMSFNTQQVMRSETYLAATSHRPLHMMQLNPFKYNLLTAPFKDSVTLTVVFGHTDRERFNVRVRELQKTAPKEVDRLLAGYQRSLEEPAIDFKNKSIQSFLANTRAMLDASKVKDIPGAIRGANSGYWVWGWDAFGYSDAYALVQDAPFAVEMLGFFEKYSHPDLGIFHSMTHDLKPYLPMAFNAQSLYAILLYDAYLYTGDKAMLRTYFAFAKKLVDRAGKEEVGDTGFVRGFSIYPDAVDTLGENGDDISTMNNSIYYQALRAMEALALEIDENDIAADFKKRGDRLLKSFDRLFDPKKGFYYTSISASDFKPRPHYGVHAIFWMTPAARDLVAPHAAAIAKFMEDHLQMRHGFRIMPKWDAGYMRDGNNNGYYDPYVERFWVEAMKLTRNKKQIDRHLENVAWFWDQLTIPEAMTAEMENHGITVDATGRQQVLSLRIWYTIFMHTLAGIDLDCEGLVFSACATDDIGVRNLHIRGRELDLKITGRGWKIKRLLLNGEEIKAPYRIPFSALKKKNTVRLQRA